MTERKDVWASGDAYEPYVGRWSRLIARQFIAWLRVPRDKVWLDIGCGTGVLSQVILDNASPQHVAGVDPSDGFVAFARHKVTNPRATFQVGDAQNLPVADNSFDATVAGLVIKFRSRSGKSCTRNGASDALWRHHRCIRLGLCWRNANDASLLGCGSSFGSKRYFTRRGPAFSRLPSRAFGKPLSACRARWCGSPIN